MSYLSRHRPICAVIEEIAMIANAHGEEAILELCEEALDYARRMSARLVEYKRATESK